MPATGGPARAAFPARASDGHGRMDLNRLFDAWIRGSCVVVLRRGTHTQPLQIEAAKCRPGVVAHGTRLSDIRDYWHDATSAAGAYERRQNLHKNRWTAKPFVGRRRDGRLDHAGHCGRKTLA